jgi:Tol biopolymer transport system component
MILLDSEGTAKTLTPRTFNGKTYDDLRAESMDLSEGTQVFWNGQAAISPDASSVAYISNKADMKGSWDLFLLDMNTENEIRIADDETYYYSVEGWLDNDHIICSKFYDKDYSIVIVSKNGAEYHVKFAVDQPILLGARDGMIACGSTNCDVIYFSRFNQSDELTDIAHFNVNGAFRVSPGIDPFSPDGSKFAYIFVPESNEYGRDICVIDLKTLTDTHNETVPFGTKNDTAVLEFAWHNNDALFASVTTSKDGKSSISSWVYHIPSAGISQLQGPSLTVIISNLAAILVVDLSF